MKFFRSNTWQFLFRPVSPSSLGLLRICFGVLMLWEFTNIKPYIMEIVTHSKFFITFDYFHWVKPCSPDTMETIFTIGAIASAMMILGLFHRLSSFLVFISWTYIFLICRGHYTNHYYLFCLVGFWMTMTNANRWASVDLWLARNFPSTRKWILGKGDITIIPYWQVLVFQLQLFVVYFFGGLAKINYDWLMGYPMRIWLPQKDWLPGFMQTDAIAFFMSWTGMLFDTLIGFVLFSKYRKWGIPFVLSFHVLNQFIFRTIGGFPHFMAAATLIYFHPSWPNDVLKKIFPGNKKESKLKSATKTISAPVLSFSRKVLLFFFLFFWSWQFLYPLRHFIYPGDPSITGEGSVFAWRMMLTSRDYGAKLKVKVKGETYYITGESIFEYVNFRQFTRMCRTPKSFHRFAHFIRDKMKKTDPTLEPEIYAYLIVSYNGRPYAQVIDTTVNLAALPYKEFGHVDWVRTEPWEEPPGNRYLREEEPVRD